MPAGRYAQGDIEVLDGLEAVRHRPSMYVGDVASPDALAFLTLEPLCLAVDAHTGGPALSVTVTLFDDDTAAVANDGPGLPLGRRPDREETYVETIMTRLYACLEEKAEAANKRWCGAGVAVLCALSESCVVTIARDGGVWEQRFERGIASGPIARTGDTAATGTTIRFAPDRSILTGPFDASRIEERLAAFRRDVPCVTASIVDLRRSA